MQKQSANFFRVAFLKLDIESKIMQIEVEILIWKPRKLHII